MESRVVPALTIIPTFASTITSDPNAATIEASINRVIAAYKNTFADNINVNITFQESSSGLGRSSTNYYLEPYTSYHDRLIVHATTADDTTALANLPAANPITGTVDTDVHVTSALENALGLAPGLLPDSTITLNVSIMNLDRAGAQDPAKYDLMSVVGHEIDEALGAGSGLDGLTNGASTSTTHSQPLDLFRYASAGVRSYDTQSATQAFFSIDGGNTTLAHFNQTNPGDFGDWYSPGGQIPQVQDAFGTPGAKPNLNVELRRLDVLGYTRVAPIALNITPPPSGFFAPGVSTAFNLGTINNGSGPFAVTVSWGDGTADTTSYVNDLGSLGTQNHTYAIGGNYTPSVSITDFTSQTGSSGFTVVSNKTDVSVVGGDIVVTGTAGDDPVTIAINGSNYRFTSPSGLTAGAGATQTDATTVDIPISAIMGSLQINANAGNDTLTIDSSAGDPFPPGGIAFHGGGQSGDKIVATGGTYTTITNNYSIAAPGFSGSIIFFGNQTDTLTYDGVKSSLDISHSTTTNLIFNLPDLSAASPSFSSPVLEDDGTLSNGISQIRATTGTFPTTKFASPAANFTLNRGNAGDLVIYHSTPDLSSNVTIGSAASAFSSVALNGTVTLASSKVLTVFAGLQILTNAGKFTTSGGGSIALTTDSMEIDAGGVLNAGSGVVTIAPLSSGRPVTLGAEAAGTLSLTDAEFNGIVAGTLRIGDKTFGGPITLAGPINVANNTSPIPTLHLLSNGAVINNVSGQAAIVATSLAIEGFSGSGSTTTLTTQVSSLAASYAGAYDLNVSNTGDLAINVIDGVTSTGSTGGGMSLTTAGSLTINTFTGSNSGPTQLTAAGQDKTLTFASIVSGQGDATFTADKMALNVSVNFVNFKVTVLPWTAGNAINLGSATDNAAGTLEISTGELLHLLGKTVQIGDSNSGPITVSSTVSSVSGSLLSLTSGGAISIAGGTVVTSSNIVLNPGPSATVTFAKSGTDLNLGVVQTLSFATGADLAFAINGPVADSQFQQLNVIGHVDLTGTDLVLSGNSAPAVGSAYILVNNDGTDAITGTFNGLSEGQVFSVSNSALSGTFQITYRGNDGNDVVLTTLNTTTPTLKATPGDDNWLVKRNANNLELTLNNLLIWTTTFSSLTSLVVNGLSGNDTLTVDCSAGDAIPSGGISFNGGASTATGDELILTGGDQGTVNYNYTNSTSGSVSNVFGTIAYTQTEQLANPGTIDDLTLNPPLSSTVYTLGDEGIIGNGLTRFSGSTIPQTDFASPTGSLTLHAHGADNLTINAIPDFTAGLTVGSPIKPGSAPDYALVQVDGEMSLASNKSVAIYAGFIATNARVTTSDGDIILDAWIDATVSAGLASGGGDVSLIASDTNSHGTVTLSPPSAGPGGSIATGAGAVLISGADLDIEGPVASSSIVTITSVPIFSLDVGDSGILSDAELDEVTAPKIQLGSAAVLQVAFRSAITRSSATDFAIVSGGNIVFVTGSLDSAGGNVILSPGATPTVIAATPGTDIATGQSGTLSFATGSSLSIAINGTTVDTDYQQLNVIGNVNLTGVNLDLSGTYSPKPGDQFVIVKNGGGNPITGEFSNLPDGKTFHIASGTQAGDYTISYHGDGGNDVVITALNDPPTFNHLAANYSASDENTQTHGPASQQLVPGWATNMSAGPANEAGQTLTFKVTTDNDALFAVKPAVGADGTLTYTPAPNAHGTAHVNVVLQDDGGGNNSSQPATFQIDIIKTHALHNSSGSGDRIGLDVTGSTSAQPDGFIVAGDVLAVINYINANHSGKIPDNTPPGPPYPDVVADDQIVAEDVVTIINYINAHPGQSEAAAAPATADAGAIQPANVADTGTQTSPISSDLMNLLAADSAEAEIKRRRSAN